MCLMNFGQTNAVLPRTAPAEFTRRELFLWFAAGLVVAGLIKPLSLSAIVGLDTLITGLSAFNAFQLLAWFAVMRLLAKDALRVPASVRDCLIIAALGTVNLLPAPRITWTGAGLFALYLFATGPRSGPLRAAALVLWALCVQAVVGPLIFNWFTFDLLRADAALVGWALEATQRGFTWHDNVIETTGHSIEVFNGCSSFHNISLAALCWVTLTMMHRTYWIPTDFAFGALACVAMIVLNAVRLYAMAQNVDAFKYWHEGVGAQIFALTATAVIVLIALRGASLGRATDA